MLFVNQTAEIVEFPYSDHAFKQVIELAGRVCYHTEDKMDDTSYESFVETMKNGSHLSVLEHGAIYLAVSVHSWDDEDTLKNYYNVIGRYRNNKYSRVIKHVEKTVDDIGDAIQYTSYYITTNYRVIVENGWDDDLTKYMVEPTKYHEKRVTVKFSMDRVGTQSVVRHRGTYGNGYTQESTRYCNYSKDKFGNEIKVTPPQWVVNAENANLLDIYSELEDKGEQLKNYCNSIVTGNTDSLTALDWWLYANLSAEYAYMQMTALGISAQNARSVLPLDLNSVIYCTFNMSDWEHFFDLRLFGTTGVPHPDIKALSNTLYDEFVSKGLLVSKKASTETTTTTESSSNEPDSSESTDTDTSSTDDSSSTETPDTSSTTE